MMELSYTQHYSTGTTGATAGGPPHADALSSTPSSSHSPVDITFTATASAGGSLLIGENRPHTSVDKPIVLAPDNT